MEKLKNHISTTRKARFNASRRIFASHIASLVCISFSSLFIICINIFELLPSKEFQFSDGIFISEELNRYHCISDVFSIILSSFVLVMSVIVFGFNYNSKAENFHSCGVELTELQDKCRILSLNDQPTTEKMEKYTSEYHNILKHHNLNHRSIDHSYTIAREEKDDIEKPPCEKTMTAFRNWRVRVWWHLSNDATIYWLFLAIEFVAVFFLLVWRYKLSN